MNHYPVPATIRLSVLFTVVATGEPVDPVTVILRLQRPRPPCTQGDLIEESPERDDVGAYHYDLLVELPGVWRYRWEGTGGVVATSKFQPFAAT